MKRSAKILMVASVSLLITGCGGKKMTCEYSRSDSYSGKEVQKITYDFTKDGKKLNKVTNYREATYTDKYLSYMDERYSENINDVLNARQEECKKYDDIDFISCKANLKGKTVSMTLTYDLKKLDKDVVKNLYDDDEISSSVYHDIIDLLEKDYDDLSKSAKDSSYKYSCK